jgi:cation:H+ antiporter
MTWTVIVVHLLGGFVLLAKGADWLVGGGTSLARRMGVSTLVVGLTVVAWGTSAPEVVVSGVAAWNGEGGMSLGNVLGSNIANIGLVLGASAAVLPSVLQGPMRARELFWLFTSLAVLWSVSLDSALTRQDGAILLVTFAIHNVHLFLTLRDGDGDGDGAVSDSETSVGRSVVGVVLGMTAILVGAYLALQGAEAGAYKLGMTKLVVGLTVLAVGTSLPELAAGLGGAFKGQSDISVGNVVGSNIFNLIAVLGIVAMVRPLVPSGAPGDALEQDFARALANDFPMVLGFSVAAALLPWLPGSGRIKGIALLVAFGTYIGVRVLEGRVA